MGAASRWWLARSLEALQASGVPLVLRCGKAGDVLRDVLWETGADAVYWNQTYEPWPRARDATLQKSLPSDVKVFQGSLLFQPDAILNQQGSFFRVFTPFWKRCLSAPEPSAPLPKPKVNYASSLPPGLNVQDLGLLSGPTPWWDKFESFWQPGEGGAVRALQVFLENALSTYKADRDFPGRAGTSRLSPTCTLGRSVRKPSGTRSRRLAQSLTHRGTTFCQSWGGESFQLTYCTISLSFPPMRFRKSFKRSPGARTQSCLRPGSMAKPASPLLMPGCVSFGGRGICIIACVC